MHIQQVIGSQLINILELVQLGTAEVGYNLRFPILWRAGFSLRIVLIRAI